MIKAVIFDLSRVLLFPKDKKYEGSLNELHKKLSATDNYQFFDQLILNQEIIDYIDSQKDTYKMFLYTSDTIHEAVELVPLIENSFVKVFSGAKLKLDKKESNSYLLIANNLRLDRSEILFIDDVAENIAAAKESGLATILYKNNKQLLSELKKILK